MRLLLVALLAACKQPPPAPTIRVLLHEDGVENAYPRLSRDGREVLYQSNRSGTWQLYVLELATGTSRQLTTEGANNLPDWSPDNQRIAFVSTRDGNEEIYVMNASGSTLKRITNNAGRDLHPYFTPDGTRLVYNSQRGGSSFDVFAIELATGDETQLTATHEDETCARFAADGRMVMLRNDATGDDIWVVDVNAAPRNLTQTPPLRDGWPTFSPDGRWIYYAAMETGGFSLYRIRPDGTSREQLTDVPVGDEDARPHVSSDGRRVVFNRRHGTTIEILELGPIS